ncbi:MAG: substrate-binding domain-containing protein [Spirochaetales bacterium]|nr:substrate-binding domain-containing protein [Spirochaetales bacterium]
MKNWYLLILSLMAALGLFLILSLFYNQNTSKKFIIDKPIQIVMKSTQGLPMDFWDVVNQGIAEASREFGVEYEVTGPRFEREINRQITIMNSVIEKDPPLIILAATDYVRLGDSIQEATRRGIPIITLDSGVESPDPVSFIATDNLEAGNKAGTEMRRLIDGHEHKQIAIVSHIKETATGIEREAGTRQALENYNVIGTWYCDVDQDKAYRITMDLLKNPELGGIVALNEVASLGVGRAIAETGTKDKVLVVGFDNAIKELSYLEEGVIKATVVQRPYNMGYMVIKTAVDYLSGKKIPAFIDTGSILITRENMFEREYQELLFPFNDQQ